MQLQQFLRNNPKIAIAFSGGVDSTYLLYAAKAAGCDVSAYFIKSQFQPRTEHNDAIRLAAHIGASLKVDALNILDYPEVTGNPADRCYFCKTRILQRLKELAYADGYTVICDGTNSDDDESDRPGMRAQRELGVISPLRQCGLTKADIRRLSEEAGLPTYDKPSYACLATRIPTGTVITESILEKIERSEEALMEMGFSDFRVRFVPPGDAKVQVQEKEWVAAAARRREILSALQPLFTGIVLDMNTR